MVVTTVSCFRTLWNVCLVSVPDGALGVRCVDGSCAEEGPRVCSPSSLDVVYCPRRDCASAVIREKSSSAAMCSVCGFAFCIACRRTYHGAGDCRQEQSLAAHEDAEAGKLLLPKSQGTPCFIVIKSIFMCRPGLIEGLTLSVRLCCCQFL